ncbi:hypothetical protein [Pannonibacter indicus]|uniref:hypothetical protein n=1 Tax=Pannonibacter indicus TaxID=466044 RepID=UPI001FCB0462|nr:hypothetical protein [Pannonibacter indicus]
MGEHDRQRRDPAFGSLALPDIRRAEKPVLTVFLAVFLAVSQSGQKGQHGKAGQSAARRLVGFRVKVRARGLNLLRPWRVMEDLAAARKPCAGAGGLQSVSICPGSINRR